MPKSTFHNLPDDKRQRIIDAALDEFAAVHFDAASVNRIVRGAGIAKGSFYQYFEGLADLYRYLLLHVVSESKMAVVMADPAPPNLGFYGQLAWSIRAGLRWTVAEPRHAAAGRGVLEPIGPDSNLRPFRDELDAMQRKGMEQMLQAGKASGAVDPDLDIESAAVLTLVLLQQGLDALLQRRFGLDLLTLCKHPERGAELDEAELDALVHALTDMLHGGLGGDSNAGRLDIEAFRTLVREQDP